MKSPGEGSAWEAVFYRVGLALGEVESLVGQGTGEDDAEPGPAQPGHPGAARAAATRPAAAHADLAEAGTAVGAALGATAGGWIVSRLLRPHPVRWPRVVVAGLAATALAELARRIEVPAAADSGRFPPGVDELPRYVGGIATAAAYASLLYPRLPGSPLTRGLLFGALDVVADRAGGTFGVLRRIAPQLALPLESLADTMPPRGGPIAGLAFGLGLGLYAAPEHDD